MAASNAALAALGAFLDYPDSALLDSLDAAHAEFKSDQHIPDAELRGLERFIDFVRQQPLPALQENYVDVFDRERAVSLYLCEHAFEFGADGATDRAPRRLRAMYATDGLYLKAGELPDYLPVFVDYLARQPWRKAQRLLHETVPILTEIADRLHALGSEYCRPVVALVALAGGPRLTLPLPAEESDDLATTPDPEIQTKVERIARARPDPVDAWAAHSMLPSFTLLRHG